MANEFAFSTKQASLGTGLIDFGYRHYDPTTARWTRRDPLVLGNATNLYAYVSGNPVGMFDPWGCEDEKYEPGTYLWFGPGSTEGQIIRFMGGGPSHCAIVWDEGHVIEMTAEGLTISPLTEEQEQLICGVWTGKQEERDAILKRARELYESPVPYEYNWAGLVHCILDF